MLNFLRIIPHQNADPKIDGADITQLSLIGQIIRVEAQATNTTYTLDDGTGTFQVKKWIDGDAAPEDEDASLKEGQYVHVWGRIKDFNGKRHVISHIIRPITDYNEISAHLLEATAVHLYFTRGPVDAQNGAAARSEGMFVDSYGDAKNGAAAVGNRLPAGMSALSKSVFKVLEEAPQNNEGLNIQHIAQQLKASAIDVHKAGDELLQHGLIYTTIDDETWAVLE